MLIVSSTWHGKGWNSINHMIPLAVEAFDATIVDARQLGRPSSLACSLAALGPRRRSGNGKEPCLLIAASPTDLLQIFNIPNWRTRFSHIFAWVFDSFWIDWIPKAIRAAKPFDHIFISSGEDLDAWADVMGERPTWLPWGSDALHVGSGEGSRDRDLTRLGRQPAEWDDDEATGRDASAAGLRFQPRPPALPDSPREDHRRLMKVLGRSRYVLAFSNLSHHSAYTHSTRAYLTGRWVDSLAAGAVVAGISPRGACIDTLLWPGATLELGGTERSRGLAVIAEACATWTPRVAERNHAMALRRLDWHWRFQTVAKAVGITFPPLERKLEELRDRLVSLGEPRPG